MSKIYFFNLFSIYTEIFLNRKSVTLPHQLCNTMTYICENAFTYFFLKFNSFQKGKELSALQKNALERVSIARGNLNFS